MTSLTSVLRRYAGTGPQLGAEAFPTDALRKDLQAVIRSNNRYFAVTFGILVLLLLLVVFLLARFLE